MDYQVISDTPNGLQSRSVWLLIKDGLTVKRAEAIIETEDVINVVIPPRLETLYETGEVEADGVRVWFAIKQRLSDELLDQTIFAVFGVLQQGGTLAQMTMAGDAVLSQDPFQQGLSQQLKTVFAAASAAEQDAFVALALTVAYGKIGQR